MLDIDDDPDEVPCDFREEPDHIDWGDGLPHARPDEPSDNGNPRPTIHEPRPVASAAPGLDTWLWFG